MENFEDMGQIGQGASAVTKLFRDNRTMEVVAIKMMKRGKEIDTTILGREISNHQQLQHPHVVQFKEVILTPTHVAIVMEYAQGGDLFDYIKYRGGRLPENQARCLFQQIIAGVGYCHLKGVCHRDLKPENVLRDAHGQIKICDFGYSKSFLRYSRPKTLLGTPHYIAPEIFAGSQYRGDMADIWSCGVILFVMLAGSFPFDDPSDSSNIEKIMRRVMAVQYEIPGDVSISDECKELLSRIFVSDPRKRYNIWQIKRHPWFLKDLSAEISNSLQVQQQHESKKQVNWYTETEIKKIVEDATTLPRSGVKPRKRFSCFSY